MSKRAVFAFLAAVGVLEPDLAAAQQPVELAFADPQPHFVAAWAPKKAREAERSAVLARRLSLELADVSLDSALKALTKEAGLHITYSPALLPAERRVTINAGDIAVVTALTEILFRSGIDVVVDREGALALVLCNHPGPKAEVQDSGTMVGTVTDKSTGAPLAGAAVEVDQTALTDVTDGDGRYRITGVPAGTREVRVRFIGYAPLEQIVQVPADGEVVADFALTKSLQKLDELVTVTAGGIQTEIRAIPTPVTVITADDMEKQRPLALLETIRQAVPGAVTFFSPSRPEATGFSARGASSLSGLGAMKIFVDGIEASAFDESPVDPLSIERIEVVRGPQASAQYGSNAAGGVVQIFTKRGSTGPAPAVEVRAQAGVVQTPYEGRGGVLRQQYAASVGGGGRDVRYNIGAGYSRLGDWLPSDERSRQSTPSLYGRVQYARSAVELDIHGRYLRNQLPAVLNPQILTAGFTPLSRPPYADQDITNETYGTRIAVSPRNWLRNQVTMGIDRLAVANVQYRYRLTSPEDTLFQIFTQSQRKLSLAYNAAVSGTLGSSMKGSLIAGIDYYRSDASIFSTSQALNTEGTIETSPPGAFTLARSLGTNTGYFVQTEIGLHDAVFLTAGIRADDNSAFGQDFGVATSPRLGISMVKQLGRTTAKARAGYGRAIRAPSAGQAAGATTVSQINLANPFLAPEEQFGWDVGIDLAFGSLGSLSLSGYDQTAKNLISFQQVASSPLPTFQFQNIGRVANSGIELEGMLGLSAITLSAQYAYTRSRIEDLGPAVPAGVEPQVGDRPLGLPTHTAGATLTLLPRGRTTATAGLTYVGSFRQLDVLGLVRCLGGTGPCKPTFNVDYPGFAKLNLSVTRRITRQLEGFISINNVTNEQAYEGSNAAPVIGRATVVGAHLRY